MYSFLRRINLIVDYNFELSISKTDFIKKFRQNVEFSTLSFDFFEGFEIFFSSKFEYKGFIDNQSFHIKKKRKLFEQNQSQAIAKGNFTEENEKLYIEIEINAFNKMLYLLFVLLILFYGIFLNAFIFGDSKTPFFIFPFILFHGFLIIGIPYFFMRRSVKKLQYKLERDFNYWNIKK
ncbi:hypothetical protein [uncultured Flavobacterium sp.]|jgi:hypothetical protein|uniref:hypothetical protein n=1 Tax=uncultured Flavobacterium sp. TaxID=165435 RepID=UPI002596C50E|nr:hypothetical protein [uncultured Flavobacterium sp.]